MSEAYWWILEQEAREMARARMSEVERARLVRLTQQSRRPVRARLAGALRVVAVWLEGDAWATGDRLAVAR